MTKYLVYVEVGIVYGAFMSGLVQAQALCRLLNISAVLTFGGAFALLGLGALLAHASPRKPRALGYVNLILALAVLALVFSQQARSWPVSFAALWSALIISLCFNTTVFPFPRHA